MRPKTHKLSSIIKKNTFTLWLHAGDSISEDNHCTEGYPNYLRLADNVLRPVFSKKKYSIFNTAVGGRKLADEVLVLNDKLHKFQPDFISLMFGMNDSAAGSAALDEFIINLRKTADILKEYAKPCVFFTQNPLDYRCDIKAINCRKDYPLFAKAVTATCIKEKIPLVDIYTQWKAEVLEKDNNEHFKLMHDAVHPNHKGHEYIFQIIRKKILGV
ncbi:MAG: hypothetical protein A2096_04630 [Spirochaetes bacterium GWF1_41_5]|nr:MAG: hypothetical protein A2096_04630 [Spirochaetes bacterium GWF1_41_5]HBE01954.1 hypothetical protein [Spirochaetia bacterium]